LGSKLAGFEWIEEIVAGGMYSVRKQGGHVRYLVVEQWPSDVPEGRRRHTGCSDDRWYVLMGDSDRFVQSQHVFGSF
jgi:hypothetical protein